MHRYTVETSWTGRTTGYRDYARDHLISGAGKRSAIEGSSDPVYRGDGSRYNPEELVVAAISTCHMLWVLHLCADAGIVVTSYEDRAEGVGEDRFTEVVLRPKVTIENVERTRELAEIHHRAHEQCWVANSMNFPVRIEPAD